MALRSLSAAVSRNIWTRQSSGIDARTRACTYLPPVAKRLSGVACAHAAAVVPLPVRVLPPRKPPLGLWRPQLSLEARKSVEGQTSGAEAAGLARDRVSRPAGLMERRDQDHVSAQARLPTACDAHEKRREKMSHSKLGRQAAENWTGRHAHCEGILLTHGAGPRDAKVAIYYSASHPSL